MFFRKTVALVLTSIVLSVAALVSPLDVHAAVCTWNGSAGGSWANGSNWTGCSGIGGIPTSADSLIFPTGITPSSKTMAQDIPGLTVNSLTFNDVGYVLNGPDGLGLTAGITNSVVTASSPYTQISANLTLAASQTFTSAGVLELHGTVDLNGNDLTLDTTTFPNGIGVDGTVTGAGNLVKNGPGVLILDTANTYTGTTTLNAGITHVRNATSLGSAASGTTVASGATISMDGAGGNYAEPLTFNGGNGLTVDAAGIIMSGTVALNAGTTTMVSNAAGATTISGAISGSGNVVFGGLWGLSGISSYNGTTTIEDASIVTVFGNQTNSDVFFVGSGMLMGYGTVGDVDTTGSNGTIDPGTNAGNGVINTADFKVVTGGTLHVDLNGTGPRGGQYDGIDSFGTVTLTGGVLEVNPVITFPIGTSFLLIDNDLADAVTGTGFAGLPLDGSIDTFVAGNNTWQISYTAGVNNNDVIITAVPNDTTVSVVSDNNPSYFSEDVTFTADVDSAVNAGAFTGSVVFYDNGVPIPGSTTAVDSNGIAAYTTSSLTVGNHDITAVYSGDATYNGSTSPILVQQVLPIPTTTTVVSNLNPSISGQSVTFTATVNASSGTPTGSVNFMEGSTVLQSGVALSGNTATFTTSSLSVGTHTITAVYVPNTVNFAASSGSVNQVVNSGLAVTGTEVPTGLLVSIVLVSLLGFGVSVFKKQ